MIQVVNRHTHIPSPNDFYIGRGSPLGNPYTSIRDRVTKAQFVCGSRDESVSKYEQYIRNEISNRNPVICKELNRIYLAAKHGTIVNLVCFCMPKKCHGETIKRIIEEKLNIHTK